MRSWRTHVSNNIVYDNSYGIYAKGSRESDITNNNVSNNTYGIYLYEKSQENTITNNNVTNNDEGILLSDPKRRGRCSENIIRGNNVSSNTYGIRLFGSDSNDITRNTANSNTYYGIYLSEGSSKNIITKNTASKNYNGIYISESSDNICYLNNFANKADNVYSYKSTNTWNSTEKITYIYNKVYRNYMGNYWSDYTGSDANSDGIGDMPYSIDSDKDYYPLMVPWENYFAPIAFFTYSPENPVVNQKVTFDASYSFDIDGTITNCEWKFGDGNTTNTTEAIISHSYSSAGNYTVNLTVTDNDGTMNSTFKVITISESEGFVFDTGEGTYPSIFGTHNGTITPNQTITLSKLYTYPCPRTGGHTEYARIWNSSWEGAEARWKGYQGDWQTISFDKTFTLVANETYNYSIRTGSYPQIHHNRTLTMQDGVITCTEFIDANGKRYNNRIPAIMLE
jgi:parallel beta-helix repeat protein